MRSELLTEEASISDKVARDPASIHLKRLWVDDRARLHRELVELSQRLFEARAETCRLQVEIAELLNPPWKRLRQQVSDQRAQLDKEMEDVSALRVRQQLLIEIKREYEKDLEGRSRRVLQPNGQAG